MTHLFTVEAAMSLGGQQSPTQPQMTSVQGFILPSHVWGLHSHSFLTPKLTKNPAFCGTALSTLPYGQPLWQSKQLCVYVVYRFLSFK